MKDIRVLIVSSEVIPYLPVTEVSSASLEAARAVNNSGGQTRIFMPRYGKINERRHQLHEVIRLSGMNLIINDMDMPLIIKVASIPRERMQVYFIENEDYFKRKAIYTNDKGKLFPDNDERAIFFARGVVETVKKLNWMPHIIHVHGWMSAFVPLYLKTYYQGEPLFENSKIVTSVYHQGFEGTLRKNVGKKLRFDGINTRQLPELRDPGYINLMKLAINHSDAAVIASEEISPELDDHLKSSDMPVLNFCNVDKISEAYTDFYTTKVLNPITDKA